MSATIGTIVEEFKLTIYKLFKELNKWDRVEYSGQNRTGEFYHHGYTFIWTSTPDRFRIILDTPSLTVGTIEFPWKDGELFYTELKFDFAQTAQCHIEVLEFMLTGLVKSYARIKGELDAS